MLRVFTLLLLSASLCPLSGSAAHAEDLPRRMDRERLKLSRPYAAGDWALSTVTGFGAGFLGLGLGLGVGTAASPAHSHYYINATPLLTGAGGLLLGGATGTWAYGEMTGRHGSYWASLLGWTGGAVVGAGLVWGLASSGNGEGIWAGWILGGVAASLGGTLGYVLSLDTRGPPSAPRHGGLLNMTGRQLAVGMPDVNVQLSPVGAFERADVKLFAGRF